MRPPKLNYTHTWDVRLVIKYLACPGKTTPLQLKLLSIKLAMPFALSCPERTSSLAGIVFSSLSCLRNSEALQINYLKPFLRPFHTTRDSVPLALYAITLKLHKTYVQFFHRQSQTLCLFLTSNRIIQSLHPLLADGCAWS